MEGDLFLADTKRLIVNVEGQTELGFVDQLLAPHLYTFGYTSVAARIIGHRQNTSRRGICEWQAASRDFVTRLRADQQLWQTMMVDFYRMPKSGQDAWPGRETAIHGSAAQKAQMVENAILEAIRQQLAAKRSEPTVIRFVPFVVMHEFEGLLFSQPNVLASAIGEESIASKLTKIQRQFETPEDINDSPETSPSKRLLQMLPRYNKVLMGVEAAKEIGLPTIRSECPHFGAWLSKLESIPEAVSR